MATAVKPSTEVHRESGLPAAWDPLTVSGHEEALLEGARRSIANILKSYTGFFDPFCELLQNALDAVERRLEIEPKYKPHVWIDINLAEGEFTVTDNGIGFEVDQFKKFLAPHISYKDLQQTRGKKGVGATYLAYGFNYLEIATKTDDIEISARMLDGRKWVDDRKDELKPPQVQTVVSGTSKLKDIDRGSSFTLRFVGHGIRPSDLGWYQAANADQWKALLLLKTPMGHIAIPPEVIPEITYTIKVTDKAKRTTQVTGQIAYTYPHAVIASCAALDDILAEQRRRLDKGQDGSIGKLPDKFKKLNGVHKFWDNKSLLDLVGAKDEGLIEIVQEYKVAAYGFFCYSVRVWDHYNDEIVKLRKGLRIMRGGLQMAADHMPQGDLIAIPLTSNIGYQNQCHVVVHFHGADPDLGRKGFQPELKEAAETIAVAIVGQLKKWRGLLKKDAGSAPSITAQTTLHDWIRKQEQHEEKCPLRLLSDLFFLPVKQLPITAIPRSEQDVIVLFSQLVAGGVIRGLRLLGTDQASQYDGVFRFYYSQPSEHHLFDEKKNPLGIQNVPRDEQVSKPFVLEYKYNLDSLWAEFEAEEKDERDINLVVTWEMGSLWSKRYSVTSLLDLANLQHRPFHGVTHIFRDENSGDVRFHAIVLRELLEYLADVNGAQSHHRKVYGDED